MFENETHLIRFNKTFEEHIFKTIVKKDYNKTLIMNR